MYTDLCVCVFFVGCTFQMNSSTLESIVIPIGVVVTCSYVYMYMNQLQLQQKNKQLMEQINNQQIEEQRNTQQIDNIAGNYLVRYGHGGRTQKKKRRSQYNKHHFSL